MSVDPRLLAFLEHDTSSPFPSSDAALAASEAATVAGIDVGAVSVGVVAFTPSGEVRTAWQRHEGHPVRLARQLLAALNVAPDARLGVIGSGALRLSSQGVGARVDAVGALILATRARFPEARHLLDVGGGSLSRVSLTDEGTLAELATNSLCAAGTGSFLDEQARRLGLDLNAPHTWERVEEPPAIATRCAVFAKSDLIHRQQEGFSKPEMWSGLCRGLSATIVTTLFKGKPARGLTVVVGGVARNAEVLRWLGERLPDGVQTFEQAHLAGAAGAALLAPQAEHHGAQPWTALDEHEAATTDEPLRAPLVLHRTKYPSFEVDEAYTDLEANEVRVHAWPEGEGAVDAWLGLDIGSTSTKAVVLDARGEVLVDVYRMTGGDPLGATRKLFTALDTLFRGRNRPLNVLGAATTGSGRKLVGAVVGADLVQNEITAHVTGAMKVDPTIDTIFEIGGQDAKYMDCRGGYCRDAAMNYVCAAGTGSFVAEQAARLGFRVQDIGDATLGIAPPMTSDRCTVFMEQDVDTLIRRGFRRDEVMAAVLYSVIRNYLIKVVGPRYRSPHKVFFQGATARNKGLVAALENLLGVEVVVSPLCHVMGAYGAALLVQQRAAEQAGFQTHFLGLDLASRDIRLTDEVCTLCENKCAITHAHVEGAAPVSWGYLCGREPDEHRVRHTPGYEAFRERAKAWRKAARVQEPRRGKVGLPRAMATYGYLPLLQGFLAELGWETVLSGRTDERHVHDGAEAAAADYCFPIKLAHGHLFDLARNPDLSWILAPVFLSERNDPKVSVASNFCPLNTGLSAMYMASLGQRGQDPSRVLRPCIDLRWSEARQLRELHESVGASLGASPDELRRAWRAGIAWQARFDRERFEAGARALERVRTSGKPGVLVLGRPYNLHDERANIGLPRKMADYGLEVVPLDTVKLERDSLPGDFHNVFWKLGQDILLGARLVAQTPGLYAVVLTNFSCGPDSFVLTYLQEILGEKPHLILELDEHGADAGYVTRVEAFLDVIARDATRVPELVIPRPDESAEALKRRTIWLPPMHPFGTPLMAASLRGVGFDARALPPETRADFERGRALTRGTECLPAPCSLGTFLGVMEREKLDPKGQALFMPKAAGPCRFGQYALLYRLVLNRAGLGDVAIMSPVSENAYADIGGTGVTLWLWRSLLTADMLFKLGCRVRPYERVPGTTDRVLQRGLERLVTAFEAREEPLGLLRQVVHELEAVPVDRSRPRPLVGIVGEIFVRSNVFANQDLVRSIERAGGEAWLTPISEWIRYLGWRDTVMARETPSRLGNLLQTHVKHTYLAAEEHVYEAVTAPLLSDRREPPLHETIAAGEPWIPTDFEGEAILTIGRAKKFAEQGAAFVVNVSPFGCMVGSLSAAVLQKVQDDTGVPVLHMFYDGDGDLNRVLEVFLAGAARGEKAEVPAEFSCPPSACDACGGGCHA